MNKTEAKEVADVLAQHGWRFNPDSELFEDRKGKNVPWEHILAMLPHLSLNDLDSFSEIVSGR